MKALVYTAPETLSYQDAPDPHPAGGTDEVLIDIDSVGICGSDMHAFLGHDERRPAPVILGHEAAGLIVGGEQAGRRVTVNPLVSCGHCHACLSGRENLCGTRQIISMPPREGAFAEFLSMPERNLVTVPDHISLQQASLAEPIACGWHAAVLAEQALTQPLADISALVIGGGTIGVGAALSLLCKGIGAVTIVEPSALRREYLSDRTELSACAPDALAANDSWQLVMDCVGYAATRQQASERVTPGGVILHIGLGDSAGGLDVRRMTLQEITFIGSYTYTHQDFCATTDAMFNGQLGALDWIDIRPLSEGAEAFSDIRSGKTSAPKIVLKP